MLKAQVRKVGSMHKKNGNFSREMKLWEIFKENGRNKKHTKSKITEKFSHLRQRPGLPKSETAPAQLRTCTPPTITIYLIH